MCWGVGGEGEGGKCIWVVVREGTEVWNRIQVFGRERVRGRVGEVWRRDAGRLGLGCIRAGIGVAAGLGTVNMRLKNGWILNLLFAISKKNRNFAFRINGT